ncbi:hypothetical protein GPECTOR_59g628 [Gonium pectorale]|uniref:CULT domain-containing protein n=1 Tax=Gonium pectorale TaxID=33097 RepID=A0A150G5B9_GONPE|nr:hypothetical protein GPECTOR_59g628 [Gonium pectorale]|eukprot:KXZ45021.1 hypothetical protein GPECTOR_59g628 [Gonium pectorale]
MSNRDPDDAVDIGDVLLSGDEESSESQEGENSGGLGRLGSFDLDAAGDGGGAAGTVRGGVDGAARRRFDPETAAQHTYLGVTVGLPFEVWWRSARGLRYWGRPETEHSWFPGYAWTIANCAACGQHMGWRFTAVAPGLQPAVFWGLRRAAVVCPGLAGRGRGAAAAAAAAAAGGRQGEAAAGGDDNDAGESSGSGDEYGEAYGSEGQFDNSDGEYDDTEFESASGSDEDGPAGGAGGSA